MVPSPGTSGPAGRSLRTASSPTKLQAAAALTVVLAILLSLAGWYSVQRRSTAIDDAAAAAQQLIRVQDVRVLVVQADSLAARAYLAGGQEDPVQRESYGAAVTAAASGLIAAASASTEEDVLLLEAANARFGEYVGLVERARANNRQGFPVGAAYQRQARTVSEEVVAALREVETHSRDRVDDSIRRAHRSSWLLVLPTVLLLSCVVAGGIWMASRFRRLVNVPLAVAGLVTLVVLTAGFGVNAAAVTDADEVVEDSLTSADLLAQARAAAFDARSNEALTLIYRGNGAAYETAWGVSRSIVDTALTTSCDDLGDGCDTIDDFLDYVAGYDAVRALDRDGDWDAAVLLSTTGSAPGSAAADATEGVDPVESFESFAVASGVLIDEQVATADAQFTDAVANLDALALGVVIAGLLVAVLAVLGYGQRMREYR